MCSLCSLLTRARSYKKSDGISTPREITQQHRVDTFAVRNIVPPTQHSRDQDKEINILLYCSRSIMRRQSLVNQLNLLLQSSC